MSIARAQLGPVDDLTGSPKHPILENVVRTLCEDSSRSLEPPTVSPGHC